MAGPDSGAAFARWEGDDIGQGWRRSPDIANLIQESIDRAGWDSGTAFLLLFPPAGGRFRFRGWDYGEGEYAARLHVEYSLAATPTPTATPTPEVREVAIEYEYDALNRLTSADYSTGEYFHYTYDPVGNRLTQDTHQGVNTYVYDAANRLIEVDGVPYIWSANGELLSDGERAFNYDHGGRLSSVVVGQQTYAFGYNGLGDRLVQSVDGAQTQYTLDLNTGLTQVLSDGASAYLYGLSRIGEQGPAGWAYHLPDALGSVSQIAGPAAGATLAQSYEPFGNVLEVSGEAHTPYGFAGEWMDPTGLAHLRARYYAPYFGAFIQPDPWGGLAFNPNTIHPYLYAGASPVVYRDPSGLCWDWMPGTGFLEVSAPPTDGPCPGSEIEGSSGEFDLDAVSRILQSYPLQSLIPRRLTNTILEVENITCRLNQLPNSQLISSPPVHVLLEYRRGFDPIPYKEEVPLGTGSMMRAIPDVLPVQPDCGAYFVHRTDYSQHGPIHAEDVKAGCNVSVGDPSMRLGGGIGFSLKTYQFNFQLFGKILIGGIKFGYSGGRNFLGLFAEGGTARFVGGVTFHIPETKLVLTTSEKVRVAGGYDEFGDINLPSGFRFIRVVKQSANPYDIGNWMKVENRYIFFERIE